MPSFDNLMVALAVLAIFEAVTGFFRTLIDMRKGM